MTSQSLLWTKRVSIIAGALVACIAVMSFSLAIATARDVPQVAAGLAPYLSYPKSRLAERMLPDVIQGNDKANPRQTTQLARAAAVLDPLNSDAVRSLAYVARAQKDDPRADALFAYAYSLTRRDVGVTIDFVIRSLQNGKFDDGVRYFDEALRTSVRSWELLFPIVYQAAAAPEMTAPLARALAQESQWKWPFLDGLVRNGPSPLAAARLFDELQQQNPVRNDELNKALISRLVDAGNYREGWNRHRAFLRSRGLDPNANGSFEREAVGTPFEWNSLENSGLETAIAPNVERPAVGDSFYFRLPAGGEAELLRTVALPGAGRHELSVELGKPLEGSLGELVFNAECMDSGNLIARSVQPGTAGRARFAFTVPEECPAVRLRLTARTSGMDSIWASWLDDLALDRAAGE